MERRDPTFAPALSSIQTMQALGQQVVTPDPAPGQGYPMNEKGQLPVTTEEGEWIVKVSAVTVDIPSTATQTGGNINVTIPNLQVNDYCFFLGAAASNARAFIRTTRPLCATAETIVLDYFNADNVDPLDPGSDTFYFLCIHRRITT